MRSTLFSIFLLVVYGGIATFLMIFVRNLAGLPGAMLAGRPGRRSPQRFLFGAIVSAIGQSYVNLAYVSFIVSWTYLAAQRDDVPGLIVWPVAFLAATVPTLTNLLGAQSVARLYANAQVEALHLTFLATLLAFPLFAFVPVLMHGWSWVPMVSTVLRAE